MDGFGKVPPTLEHRAPQGMKRIIGRECGQEFFIADVPKDMPSREVGSIVAEHEGAGIDIDIYDDQDLERGPCRMSNP